ncbi:MAG: SGNH/GDSL hydrolase family protein [Actinomycetota bacterium]
MLPRLVPVTVVLLLAGLLGPLPPAADEAAAQSADASDVCAGATPAPFPDRGTVHAEAIDCLHHYRTADGGAVIDGLGDGTFGTTRAVTRGQFASLLFRLLTVADPQLAATPSGSPGFDDPLPPAHAEPIGALAHLGVLDGRADGTFAASATLSRGAAASALRRTLEVAGLGLPDRAEASFADQGEVHARAIGHLADLDVVRGVGDERFATYDDVSRGQVATILIGAAQVLHDRGLWAADPLTGDPPDEPGPSPVPRPSPATTAAPDLVAAIGDSITQASGATRVGEGLFDVVPGGVEPQRSWSTGAADGLDSILQRLRARFDRHTTGVNLAVNGARMRDAGDQVDRTPPLTELVTVQLGGNDLCRPSVGEMTAPGVYEDQLHAALEDLTRRHPTALVQVSSIPDIYRLWELLHTDPTAVAVWNGTELTPALIPCQSLLADATSDAPQDQERREQVREHGRELNRRLAAVCAEFVRCRYDADALWEFTHDPDRFVAADISAVDYFHPSFLGQRKLAAVAWRAGFDHGHADPSSVDVEVVGSEVVIAASGSARVAGLEHRLLEPGARRPSWTSVVGDTTSVPVSEGDLLEVRAVDVEGSTGRSVVVEVEPGGP